MAKSGRKKQGEGKRAGKQGQKRRKRPIEAINIPTLVIAPVAV